MKNKTFVYVTDVILLIGISMSLFCIFTTNYFTAKQHTEKTPVIEMNPAMRGLFNNKETFEELPKESQRAINYKWKFYNTVSLSHIFLIIPYILIRRRVVKEKYKDNFPLWMLFTFAGGIFLMNVFNFANDFGYLIGRMI